MSSDQITTSDRAIRSARLDFDVWASLNFISDAYYESTKQPAVEGIAIEAMIKPTMIPAEPSRSFNKAVLETVQATTDRLSAMNKKFNYTQEVLDGLLESINTYPKLSWTKILPFSRMKYSQGVMPIPASVTFSVPKHFEHMLPESDVRGWFQQAVSEKAKRLGIYGPQAALTPPLSIPPVQLVKTTRYFDEVFASLLAAMPVTSKIEDPRLGAEFLALLRLLEMRQRPKAKRRPRATAAEPEAGSEANPTEAAEPAPPAPQPESAE